MVRIIYFLFHSGFYIESKFRFDCLSNLIFSLNLAAIIELGDTVLLWQQNLRCNAALLSAVDATVFACAFIFVNVSHSACVLYTKVIG